MDLTTIVLATTEEADAEFGLRSALQSLAGQPLVRYVVEAARALEPGGIVVVAEPGSQELEKAVGTAAICFETDRLAWPSVVQQAARSLAVNVLIIEPSGCTYHQVRQVVQWFATAAASGCPDMRRLIEKLEGGPDRT